MTGPSFPGAVEPVLYTHEYTSFMTPPLRDAPTRMWCTLVCQRTQVWSRRAASGFCTKTKLFVFVTFSGNGSSSRATYTVSTWNLRSRLAERRNLAPNTAVYPHAQRYLHLCSRDTNDY